MERKARTQRTLEEKWQIVLECLKSGNVAETCRKYEIVPILYYRWKDEVEQAKKIKQLARALGLHFIPLAQEPYRLVIRRQQLSLLPVQTLIETLGRASFRHEVEACTGTRCAQLASVLFERMVTNMLCHNLIQGSIGCCRW